MPYALGRPLGSADDPSFQKDVLRAAFALLETATEPTIADYAIEAPDEAGPEVWACPLNLPVAEDSTHAGRLLAEVARLAPWAYETRAARGRTLFGVTGATPDQVDDVARALGSIADSGNLTDAPTSSVEWAFGMPILVRHLADDLRSVYHEAIAAQPGPTAPNHDALNQWIFSGTALGDVLQQIAHHFTAASADNPIMTLVRGFIIPEGHYDAGNEPHWSGVVRE